MSCIKEIDIKNRTYYFFDDTINIKFFDSNQIKIDKKSNKNLSYVKISSVDPLYLIIDKVDRYIEENNENKYLTLVSTDKSKGTLKKYTELWDKIKDLIRSITKTPGNYDEKHMKIKFNSDNILPLNKILKVRNLTVVVRSLFKKKKSIIHKFS